MFTIDENALQDAFTFDEDLIAESLTDSLDFTELFDISDAGIDLGGMVDFGDIQIDLPAMEGLNMENLLGSVNLNVSADALTAMISSLLNGYQEYAAAHPEADYSHLGETFLAFLKTEDGRAILCENLKDILLENGDITVSTEQFQALFREIMEGTGFI